MQQQECFELGFVSKPLGLKGDLVLFLDVDNTEKYKKMESVFVELDNKRTLFHVESIRIEPKNYAVVRFKEVKTLEDAQRLMRCKLYLPLEALPPIVSDTQFYYHEVEGFSIIDQENQVLGEVLTVLDIPNNPLFEVKHGSGKNILLPAREPIFIRLDRAKKYIYVQVPEDLLSIYL
jgi:16S rRNA processing protein RimM